MAKKHQQRKQRREVLRVVEYLVTGGAWFWSGYAAFALLYSLLGWKIIPAKIVSYIFGLTVNFILERFWVFDAPGAKKHLEKVTARYVLLSIINLGIDTVIVWSLAQAGLTPYLGQFVSAGFFTVWNYLWYKYWIFARQKAPRRRAAAPALHRVRYHKAGAR